MTRLFRRLRRDARGVTMIEFAFVAPVMLLLLMGLCDMAYQCYVQAMLTGALQKAGRDSTIQGAGTKSSQIDATVMSWVRSVASQATYVSSRKSYGTFGSIKPEAFVDTNANGTCDANESFTDINGNNTWDRDPGIAGQGGANDVVLYKVTVTYPRLFPLAGLIGWPSTQQISASTILKNQPWAAQNVYTATPGTCP